MVTAANEARGRRQTAGEEGKSSKNLGVVRHLGQDLLKLLAQGSHGAAVVHLAVVSGAHATVELGALLGLLEAVRLRVYNVVPGRPLRARTQRTVLRVSK